MPSVQQQRLFRIRFVIEGITYAVTPILDVDQGVALKAYRFVKLVRSGKAEASYDVSLTVEGGPECECLGFLRHRRCKHVRTLMTAGTFPKPGPVK